MRVVEHKLQLKYILGYVLFIIIQLYFFSPKMVVGVNVPIIFTYLFDLFENKWIQKFRASIEHDTTFIALLLTITSITLIFIDIPFIGTILLLFSIIVLWGIKKEV